MVIKALQWNNFLHEMPSQEMLVCSASNIMSPHMVTFLCKVLPAVKEQVISMCINP